MRESPYEEDHRGDTAFGAIVLLGMALALGVMWFAASGIATAAVGNQDWYLAVMDRGDPKYPLAVKRFISFYDCRDEREWLMSLLDRTNANPTLIVCTQDDVSGS